MVSLGNGLCNKFSYLMLIPSTIKNKNELIFTLLALWIVSVFFKVLKRSLPEFFRPERFTAPEGSKKVQLFYCFSLK